MALRRYARWRKTFNCFFTLKTSWLYSFLLNFNAWVFCSIFNSFILFIFVSSIVQTKNRKPKHRREHDPWPRHAEHIHTDSALISIDIPDIQSDRNHPLYDFHNGDETICPGEGNNQYYDDDCYYTTCYYTTDDTTSTTNKDSFSANDDIPSRDEWQITACLCWGSSYFLFWVQATKIGRKQHMATCRCSINGNFLLWTSFTLIDFCYISSFISIRRTHRMKLFFRSIVSFVFGSIWVTKKNTRRSSDSVGQNDAP